MVDMPIIIPALRRVMHDVQVTGEPGLYNKILSL